MAASLFKREAGLFASFDEICVNSVKQRGCAMSAAFEPRRMLRHATHGQLTEVGIVGMSVYIPRTAVAHADLEVFDGVPTGKYTIGLGQVHMAFVTDCEDVVSLALTAVDDLVRAYNISYRDIGRLEVGTETVIDKSKSIKSSLMQLFEESGNFEVEGLDNTNACYGGTAALFNTAAWLESSAWDGRFGIVVTTDIAVYDKGPARATGGAGAVAMLLGRGPEVCIRFEKGLRSTRMEHTYDFFKPRLGCEYPTVNGQATIDCYVKAIDACYALFSKRAEAADGRRFSVAECVDYCIFHAPFNKMVKKALARLIYHDFLRTAPGSDVRYASVEQYRALDVSISHRNRAAQNAFVELGTALYEEKCAPAAWLAKEIGNAYTASLYSSLCALVAEEGDRIVGKRLLFFSFGSGCAASMFSMRVDKSVERMKRGLKLRERLCERIIVPAAVYDETLRKREQDYCRFGYVPSSDCSELFPGTYYLAAVGKNGERKYCRAQKR